MSEGSRGEHPLARHEERGGVESLGVVHEYSKRGVMCLESPNRPSHRCHRDASHYSQGFLSWIQGFALLLASGGRITQPSGSTCMQEPFLGHRLGVTTSRGGKRSTSSFIFLLNRSTRVRELTRVPQGESFPLHIHVKFFSLPSDSFLSLFKSGHQLLRNRI
jgi:hypothetical protein